MENILMSFKPHKQWEKSGIEWRESRLGNFCDNGKKRRIIQKSFSYFDSNLCYQNHSAITAATATGTGSVMQIGLLRKKMNA